MHYLSPHDFCFNLNTAYLGTPIHLYPCATNILTIPPAEFPENIQCHAMSTGLLYCLYGESRSSAHLRPQPTSAEVSILQESPTSAEYELHKNLGIGWDYQLHKPLLTNGCLYLIPMYSSCCDDGK